MFFFTKQPIQNKWSVRASLIHCVNFPANNFIYLNKYLWNLCFPGGSVVKNLPDREGRSPEGGNGNPLQYSCLENPMNRGAWWATVQGIAKRTQLSTHTCICLCLGSLAGRWRIFFFFQRFHSTVYCLKSMIFKHILKL